MQTGWIQLNGNWCYFQTDDQLLKNATTPNGYKVDRDGIWSLNPVKEEEVQGNQEDPKKDSDKPVDKEEKSADAQETSTLKADKE